MASVVEAKAVPGVANTAFSLAPARERTGCWVFNNTGGDLFVKLGEGASNASFSVKIVAGGLFEVPHPKDVDDEITAACSVIAGNVMVTETF